MDKNSNPNDGTEYEYWKYKEKKQPNRIHTPKCIKAIITLNQHSYKCPTCNTIDTICKPNTIYVELLERCSYCGQRIYFDMNEIKQQPYYIKACAKVDEKLQKERDKPLTKKSANLSHSFIKVR